MNGVSMDYETLEAMAVVFRTSADTLQALDSALEVAVGLLHAAGFTGQVGAELMAQYLEGIQPHVRRLADTCGELSERLDGAIRWVQEADEHIAARFGGGASTGSAQRIGITSGFADGGVYALRQGEDGMAGYAISGTQAYADADTLLITGISTTDESFLNAAEGLPDDWQENLAGVYNQAGVIVPGLGWDIGGTIQGINDKREAATGIRLDGSNPAVRSVMNVIWANANGDRELRLVGHSQGGAIIAAALQEMRREHPDVDLSFVEVVTFGSFGTNFPEGPQYHHYVFAGDPIPAAGVGLHPISELGALRRYYDNLTVLPNPFFTRNPIEYHDLSLYEQYLPEFQQVEQGGVFSPETAAIYGRHTLSTLGGAIKEGAKLALLGPVGLLW